MKKLYYGLMAALLSGGAAWGHEWTPTYPEFKPSYMEGVLVTTMDLFNKRDDVAYYEISVFDEEWNPIPFASTARLVQLDYLERESLDIYVRASDFDRVEYICSLSKILSEDVETSAIQTKVCSRVK